MSTYSIIVPVYNAQKYLVDCLNSITQQRTNINYEILLINDGSTDESGKMCNIYAESDSRIRVFHQRNMGPSTTRNFGIKKAEGKYLIFIDSDDKLPVRALERIDNFRKKYQSCDLWIWGYDIFYDTEKKATVIPQNTEVISDNVLSFEYLKLYDKFLIHSPVNKCYRSDILKKYDICFPANIALGEDLIFNNQYLRHCHNIATINKSFYIYKQHPRSLTTKYHANLFDTYLSHYQDTVITLNTLGEVSSATLKFLQKKYCHYVKQAININFISTCPLNLVQKYKLIRMICKHDFTKKCFRWDESHSLYVFFVRYKFALGLLLYGYASKIKVILKGE